MCFGIKDVHLFLTVIFADNIGKGQCPKSYQRHFRPIVVKRIHKSIAITLVYKEIEASTKIPVFT